MADAVVYAGCSVLDVRVSFGTRASLSALEQSVLRAVAAGVDTVPKLCGLLGVSSRMMYDVLGDLWRAEHLTLDSLDQSVHVTSGTAEMIAADTLAGQPGAEVNDEERPVLLDTVSGQLMPIKAGNRRAGDRRHIVPEHPGEARPADLLPEALTELMTKVLNEDLVAGSAPAEGDRKRVIRAYLTPSQIKRNGERNYRPIRVRVSLDAQERLVIRVVDEILPRRHQEAAQSRLTRLVEDQPTSSFATAMRRLAEGRPQEPDTLASALAEFAEQAARLAEVVPADRKGADADVRGASRRLTARIGLLAEQETELTLLTGREAHTEEILALIRSARTQLVLACPWVTYDGLSTFTPALEEAAARGVQVVLLWGIGLADRPDPAIREAVNSLRRVAGPTEGSLVRTLISPDISSTSHAKLVIADAASAVVTSLNFLAPSEPGTLEVGVRLDAAEGQRNPAIGDLLRWAADTMPDYLVAQSIVTDPASLRSAARPTGAEAEPVAVVAVPGEDPPLTNAALVDEPGGPAARAWATEWVQRARVLSAATNRSRPSVRLIRDGEHRDTLWSALRTARRKLLITSDKLSEDVVDAAFLEEVEKRVRDGVDVTLVYRRTVRDAGKQAAERLAALAVRLAGADGRLRLIRSDNHAKVLVFDDEAVVTSFNFLSFEGYYAGVGRRRQRAEVGVRIFSRRQAAELLATFGIEAAAPAASAPVSDAGPAPALGVAQRLLDRLDGADANELVALAASAGDPLAALAALRACGASDRQLEPVVAAVLSTSELEDDDTRDWWHWLTQHRFELGDFTAAAALHDGPAPSPAARDDARPRPPLLQVGARRGTPGLGPALVDAVLLEGLTPDECHALVAVGTHALLHAPDGDVREAAAHALARAQPPWAEAAGIALEWWDTAQRPLPMDRIRRAEHRNQAARQTERLWTELVKALQAFVRFVPGYESGSGTQKFLNRAGGPLNLLLQAADGRDRSAVEAWLEDPGLDNVGLWVDEATRAAGISKLIHGHMRPPFVSRIETIVSAARAVARDTAESRAKAEAFDDTAGLADATVAALRRILPAVNAALPVLAEPEHALAARAVRDLERLIGEEPDAANDV